MQMHAQNAQHLRTQQQLAAAQKAAAAAAAGSKPAAEGPPAKRQKTADALPPAPEDAQSLYEVLYKAEKAGAGILKAATAGAAAAAAAAAGAPGSAAAAAAAAATVGSVADGPVTSVDDLLRRAEAQAGRAAIEPAGRGRGGADKAADEDKLIAESALKRLMELQTLNRVSFLFRRCNQPITCRMLVPPPYLFGHTGGLCVCMMMGLNSVGYQALHQCAGCLTKLVILFVLPAGVQAAARAC